MAICRRNRGRLTWRPPLKRTGNFHHYPTYFPPSQYPNMLTKFWNIYAKHSDKRVQWPNNWFDEDLIKAKTEDDIFRLAYFDCWYILSYIFLIYYKWFVLKCMNTCDYMCGIRNILAGEPTKNIKTLDSPNIRIQKPNIRAAQNNSKKRNQFCDEERKNRKWRERGQWTQGK